MHAHDIFWTYVQPAGSQRSPCVERCMQAPVRCACWLRSGPGPLAAQDRPPQNPPPHKTALLCSSSSGPGAASGAGGPDIGAGAKTGVETMTQIVAAWSQQGGGMEGGFKSRIRGDRHMSVSHREVWSQVSHDGGEHLSEREEVVIYHDKSN